jgi:hypothetical protein
MQVDKRHGDSGPGQNFELRIIARVSIWNTPDASPSSGYQPKLIRIESHLGYGVHESNQHADRIVAPHPSAFSTHYDARLRTRIDHEFGVKNDNLISLNAGIASQRSSSERNAG